MIVKYSPDEIKRVMNYILGPLVFYLMIAFMLMFLVAGF